MSPDAAGLEAFRDRLIAPTLVTGDLPGIGGRLRAAPEDFRVDEIAAYPPDGRPGHLLLQLEKRGLSTDDAIGRLAHALAVDAHEIGFAGRKDALALTRQWISVPARAEPALASFEHDAIVLGPAHPHSHKLKIGHLRGNRFELVIRELAVASAVALAHVEAKLDRILDTDDSAHRGVPNCFGPQRFGPGGDGIERGLAALARGRGGARANMTVAAGQAALFNLWIELRSDRGAIASVLEGDVLAKVHHDSPLGATGGLFVCTDPIADRERLRLGEIAVTGPMFGSRTMAPPLGSAAAALDADVLAIAGVGPDALARLGRAALGTRRRMRVAPTEVEAEIEVAIAPPADDALSHAHGALRLSFTLPAGSFATQLCRELQSGR